MRKLFIFPVRVYQKCISPLFPARCRFIPTCSEYFIQAVLKYGVLKGSFLGIKRILRCNPRHEGGFDPLP